jgi:GNAT superfamily N-acetyltransferase
MAVALDGDRIVGHAVGKLRGPSPTRLVRIAELEDLYVDEDMRGSGHGARMLAYFVDWARASSAVAVQVSSYAANEGALRFYQRHGFAPTSVTLGRSLVPAAPDQGLNLS